MSGKAPLDDAAKALLSLPFAPPAKRAPKQNKGDSKQRWKMIFDDGGKTKIIEVKEND